MSGRGITNMSVRGGITVFFWAGMHGFVVEAEEIRVRGVMFPVTELGFQGLKISVWWIQFRASGFGL